MTEQALDLRRIGRALRRHWMTVLSAASIGLVLGLAVAYVQTPVYSAKSAVLLPPSARDDHGNLLRNMATEAQIAMSADLLDQAGKGFAPPLGAAALRPLVNVSAITADILVVQAEGRSGRAAAGLADAVADAYVAHANAATSDLADTTVADLRLRASELANRINKAEADIAANSARIGTLPAGSAEATNLLAANELIRADAANAARELSAAKTRIADATLAAELSRRGTRVFQTARPPSTPVSPRPLVYAALGTFAGFVLAAARAVVKDRGRRQPLRRVDIADVARAPVLASLAVPRRGRDQGAAAVLRNWSPSIAEASALHQAFQQLGLSDDHPVNVDVLVLPGDRLAPLLAAQVAVCAAAAGTPTALVVATEHPAVTALRSACASPGTGASGVRPNLTMRAIAANGEAPDQPGARLSLGLVVAEGIAIRFPSWRRPPLTVLAVTANFAIPDLLTATAQRCHDAGHPLVGVFVADPDPRDTTSGRLDLSPPRQGARPEAETLRHLRVK